MRITLSNNHTLNGKAFTDICDDLSAPLGSTNTSGRGCYPKDFKFTGWHPFCRCFAVSILKTDKEMSEDNKRIMAGEEPSKTSVNSVTDVPKEFTTWIEDNKERILAADVRGTLPYFIKDNATAVSRLIDSPLKSVGVSKVVGTIAGNQAATELSILAKSLGIDIGEPMTFEEANEMRGNPHFAKDKAYRVNCQTCVVANEMRRRGLNVEALPNTKGSALGRLSKRTERAWLDANGNIPISNVVGAQMSPIKWEGEEYYVTYGGRCKNRKQLVSAFESSVTEDGRYHVKWSWKGKAGHIITAERIDGKYRYYDPQNGRIITDFVKYIDNIKLSSGIQWLRVDNLRIDPDVAKEVLTRAGAKARIGGVSASGGTAGYIKYNIIRLRKDALNSNSFEISKSILNVKGLLTSQLYNGKKPLERFINHCKDDDEISAAKFIWHNPDKMHKLRISKLGEGKDLTTQHAQNNIDKKKKRGVVEYVEYEFDYKGRTWLVKTEHHKKGFEQFYHIRKK